MTNPIAVQCFFQDGHEICFVGDEASSYIVVLCYFQDGHEICFVGDEAFRELSQVDPEADRLLTEVSYRHGMEWWGRRLSSENWPHAYFTF